MKTCRRCAKLGYVAAAPELYYRQGDVSKRGDIKEIFANVVNKVPDAQVMSGLDATVDKMRDALKAANKKSIIRTYPGTAHAFHADYRPSYRKQQADDGWRRATAWFRENGVG